MPYPFTKKLTYYHLLLTLLVSVLPFLIFYNIWYPEEIIELTGGRGVLEIFIIVELLLFITIATLLFLSRKDSNKEIIIKYSFLCILQISASAIGYKTLYEAKPVYIAYEFNRFRVVRPIDLLGESNKFTPYNLMSGPEIIGTEKLAPSNPEFLMSIKDAINGNHPSFKVARQIEYQPIKSEVLKNAQNIKELTQENIEKIQLFSQLHDLDLDNLVYYPLTSHYSDEWIVLLDKKSADIVTYLNINGWYKNE
ncbi:hypothetical protein [Pseudoalteromonas lipolytica]|uniref:Uncharacterized protein n=1 Tax=Pseudoalteromonas lipolytica TaxID=570156 RepID=A0ABY1GNG1_9GAMM|nr:hypothetical protein [Pseudoalteromonas lipolytica]SFT66272.1 hypothetical protein SAMN04487854_106217 [Pseudoalteromonas lipolytica]